MKLFDPVIEAVQAKPTFGELPQGTVVEFHEGSGAWFTKAGSGELVGFFNDDKPIFVPYFSERTYRIVGHIRPRA